MHLTAVNRSPTESLHYAKFSTLWDTISQCPCKGMEQWRSAIEAA